MKIAFFVNYSHVGGTYFRWHNLALGFIKAGHEVDIYASDHDWKTKIRHEVRDNINYYITPSLQTVRIFYRPNDFFTGFWRALHPPQKTYEVYHLFQPFLSAYIPWKSIQRKKNKEAAFLYDWDDLWTGGLLQPGKNIRERYFNRSTEFLEKKIPLVSDGVTVCSDFLMKRVGGNAPVKVIGNGYWQKAVESKSAMRKKWKLDDGIFYIGYVGKTADELDWIIDAFSKIKLHSVTDVKLVIVGPPQSQMDGFSDEQKVNVTYLGEVSANEAREIATAVDLGLIPLDDSLFNQSRFPIKFFDFLTVGTPIYMSSVGEIALIGQKIDKAIIGSSKKVEWEDGLPNAITTIKNAVFTDNTEQVVNNYNWNNIASTMLDFYAKILNLKGLKIK